MEVNGFVTAGHTPSNVLVDSSNVLSTTISSSGVGTVINKAGKSTGYTSGTVTSTNVSVSYDGQNFNYLVAANYTSAPGDSGGIVYSYISSTNTRYTLGIHVASNGTTRYYCKAMHVNDALGCTRY
ncbi:MAG TPA: hypothetical protein VFD03_10390 [Clostridia bacterium]|nr:hypothetical protein [Clostridia bacterium]